MCWFLEQELANETCFGDLVALTQVNMPARPKQELARNYWDEMRSEAIDMPQCRKTSPPAGSRSLGVAGTRQSDGRFSHRPPLRLSVVGCFGGGGADHPSE